MRKLAILILITLPFWAVDCERDLETGTVELTFTGTYGDAPLLMYNAEYAYEDGTPLKFQNVNFYISDITLIEVGDTEGPGISLSDVELVSFKDILTEEDAERGLSFSYSGVPAGDYSGIKIGMGIAADLNDTQPGDYTPGHPLDDNYWSWARGYVFSKIEGNADLDGDGEFTDKLTYHIGQNDLYTILTFDQPFSLEDLSLHQIQLDFDLRDVLISNGEYLDISQEELTQDHTINENIYRFLWENLLEAVSIK